MGLQQRARRGFHWSCWEQQKCTAYLLQARDSPGWSPNLHSHQFLPLDVTVKVKQFTVLAPLALCCYGSSFQFQFSSHIMSTEIKTFILHYYLVLLDVSCHPSIYICHSFAASNQFGVFKIRLKFLLLQRVKKNKFCRVCFLYAKVANLVYLLIQSFTLQHTSLTCRVKVWITVKLL